MTERSDEMYLAAAGWVAERTLRPSNLPAFIRSLMLDAARHFPDALGSEKKAIVLGIIEDVLQDQDQAPFIHDKEQLELAAKKLVPSWIDAGVRVHKQPATLFSNPIADAGTETTEAVVARIADVAEQWFKNKVVTANNIVIGITAIMMAAGKFFRGSGAEKREMVLTIVKEIVNREATQIKPGDQEAIFLAIDTFGAPVVDFLVDLSTGQFDFKGFVQDIRDMCLPLSACCAPKSSPGNAGNSGGGGGSKESESEPPL